MKNKKILVVDYDFYNYSDAIAYCLRQKGFDTKKASVRIPLDLRTRIYNWIVKKSDELFHFKTAVPLLKWQIRTISKSLLKEYEAYGPDCVIFVKADYIDRTALAQMRQSKLVVWMMDSYRRYPHLIRDLDMFDHIFVFEKSDIELLQKHHFDSRFLPLCADGRFFYPRSRKRDIDILFIGAMYPERMKLLRRIESRFPDAVIQVYGYYINRVELLKKFLYKHSAKYKNFHGRVTPAEAGALYSRARICLNIHGGQSRYGANPRTFEILATRSFEIADYNPYIEETLKDGISLYRDEPELFSEIEYYLSHDAEREAVAARGYEYTVRQHMFSRRIDELIEECGW